MTAMKTSDYIANLLETQGVTHVFEVVGGMITHLVDSIHAAGRVKLVSMHHEQAAAFAADGMGRMTGIPGVAMATSGPGATNLLTGIGSCYFDSSPAVFITGQVNRAEQRGNRPIRQLGFQETDIVSMAKPITKAAWLLQSAEEVPSRLAEAFALAKAGRPGPVLVDIPMDVQRAPVPAEIAGDVIQPPSMEVDSDQVALLLRDLARARRPLILVGGGIRSGRATELLRKFVEQVRIPTVNSLMAVDALPAGHPMRMGMIGSYGNRWANLAIGQADFLLVLGSRLDVRQTGSMTEAFKGDRTIYHVDCEVGEINNRVTGCIAVPGELRSFLAQILGEAAAREMPERTDWFKQLTELRSKWPDTDELKGVSGINPNSLMHEISHCSREAAAYVADVGQHQMWAAQSLELTAEQRFLTSGGMGAMGFGLPAAIGAALAANGRPVVMIAGDGGFQLNIQELQTVVRNQLPLKLVILNNHCHGMVRQFQESYFQQRYASTLWGYSTPDFAQVARAYGIGAHTVSQPADLPRGLDLLWKNPNEPFLLQVMIDTFANAYPKIAFGHPITEMEPFVKPIEMEST